VNIALSYPFKLDNDVWLQILGTKGTTKMKGRTSEAWRVMVIVLMGNSQYLAPN